MLGATDKQIADFFEVDERTINRWKHDFPDFCQSLKAGKLIADATVASSLYHRANGYSHPETQFFQHKGTIIAQDTIKHYPPDTTAGIFWLKNRQRALWRDKPEGEENDPSEFAARMLEAIKQARASVPAVS